MPSPVDTLVNIFGGPKVVAAQLSVGSNAISNWQRRGIPDAQKWRLRQLIDRSDFPAETRTRALEALNQEWPVRRPPA